MYLCCMVMENVLLLIVIDCCQIEYSGYQILFELLCVQLGICVNNVFVVLSDSVLYQVNGLFGVIGVVVVDLYGFGVMVMLFLVDGQCMVGYGLLQGEFSLVNDLESILFVLVEWVEVLCDGVLVIYGFDVMVGVVNIILCKCFEGVVLDGNIGIFLCGDVLQWCGMVSFGIVFGYGGYVMFSGDYFDCLLLLGSVWCWVCNDGDGGDGIYYFDGGQIGYVNIGDSCMQMVLDGFCINFIGLLISLQIEL